MKIVRYHHNEKIYFGSLQGNKIQEIKGNIAGDFKKTGRKLNRDDVKLLSPVFPPDIIAIGLNYRKHVEESGMEIPDKPEIFLKASASVTGPGTSIILPEMAPEEVDFEAELAVVIGRKAYNISPGEAEDYILGFTCANDVSARDCQLRLDAQWARGKSFTTFCPLGPWIETELAADDCRIHSLLNGRVMQDAKTSDMVFGVKELVSYCSRIMPLLPGTVILTGTPAGVGFSRQPPVYLQPGDEITVAIEGLGKLTNNVTG